MAPRTAATVTVEWAPGFHPRHMPGPGDYQVLAIGGHTRLRGFAMSRGRQDDTARHEPASVKLTLDNSDGQLDQSRAGSLTAGSAGLPGTPVRVTVTDLVSGPYEVFNGFTIDGWSPTTSRGSEGWVDLPCTDYLGWVALAEMPDSTWAHWVASEDPTVWIRGDSNVGRKVSGTGAVFFDAGSNGVDAVPQGSHPESVASIVPGSSTPSMLFGPRAGVATLATVAVPSVTPDWSVAFWFKQDAGTGVRDLVRGTQGGVFRWGVRISNTGQLEAVMRDSSGNGIATATHTPFGGARYDDGQAHVVVVTFRRTAKQLVMKTDLGDATDSAWAGTAATSGTQIELGPVATTGQRPTLGEVAFWDRLVDIPGSPVAPHYIDPDYFWFLDTTNDRVDKLAHVAGVELPTMDYQVGLGWFGLRLNSITNPKDTLADALREIAESYGGATWVARDGSLRIRDFGALTDPTYAADYSTPVAHLTDEASPAGPLPVVRVSDRGRSGTRLDRVINDARFTTNRDEADGGGGGSTEHWVRKVDQASVDRYGRRRWSGGNDLQDTPDRALAEAVVDDVLARFAEPPVEVSDLTLSPWADSEAVTTFVVRDLELERCVTYTESDHTGAVVLTGDFRIQREQWSWTNGTAWTVAVSIAPVGA